jgi:hypothetical protein
VEAALSDFERLCIAGAGYSVNQPMLAIDPA